MGKAIDPDWAAQEASDFAQSRANRIARNAVTATNVMQAARDTSAMRTYHDTYGISVPKTAEITNQRQSGRCWMFSAMNVARHATMKYLDVDTFEFSQAYGMFYDKLEKANAMLERIIATRDLPFDSREVCYILDDGMSDGGYWPFAMNLIKKYGLVPKDAMPETACSKSSSEMDAQLERLLHRDAGILRKAAADGVDEDLLRAQKDEMLDEVYRVLAICLGEPPQHFDLEVKVGPACQAEESKISEVAPTPKDLGAKGEDEDKAAKPVRILRDFGLTPLEFAAHYVPFDPDDYVNLVSMPGDTRPYGHVYHLTLTDSVIDGTPIRLLNVAPEVLDQAAIASLKAGIPVSMSCDVMQNFPRHIEDFKHVLSLDGVDMDGLFDVDFDMDRTSMLDMRETSLTHAMTFQGVELNEDGTPKAWRIENSWGKEQGKDGYLIASAGWFHLYGGEVIVKREFVDDETLKMWDELPAEDVTPWSGLAAGFAKKRL
jgi:bleomycin hydrolase